MPWNLNGQIVETCSCNVVCPCWFGVKELQIMDQGWCDSALLFRISEGDSDGVKLDGCIVVMAMDFPGPTMLDGNATTRIIVDDATTPEQMRELEGIFSGAKGGSMERYATLVTNRLPSEKVAIQVQEDADSLTVTVGDFGQIRSKPLKNEAGKPVMLENAGPLRINGVQIAPSSSRWTDSAMPRSFETKSGGIGEFNWSGN